eukprot:g16130.t1
MDKSSNTTQDSEIPSVDAGTDQKKRAPLSSLQSANNTQHREERPTHGGSVRSPSSVLTSTYSIPNQSSTISSTIHSAASTSHRLAEKSSLITQDNTLSLSAIEQDNRLSLPAIEHEHQLCATNQNFSKISQISHTSSQSSSQISSQSLSQSLNASAAAASTSTLLDAQNLLHLLLQLPPGQQQSLQQSLIAQLTSAKPSSSTESTDTQQMKIPDAMGGPSNQRNQVFAPLVQRLGHFVKFDHIEFGREHDKTSATLSTPLGASCRANLHITVHPRPALAPFGPSDSYLSSATTSTLTSNTANFAPLGASDTYVSATTSALSSSPVAYGTLGATTSALSSSPVAYGTLGQPRQRYRHRHSDAFGESLQDIEKESQGTWGEISITTRRFGFFASCFRFVHVRCDKAHINVNTCRVGCDDAHINVNTCRFGFDNVHVDVNTCRFGFAWGSRLLRGNNHACGKARGNASAGYKGATFRPRRSQPASRPKKKLRMADTDLSEEEKPSIQSVHSLNHIPSTPTAIPAGFKGLNVPWTAEEDEYVYKQALALGSQWKKIGDAIKRSGPAVKHRFEEHIVHTISLPDIEQATSNQQTL